MARWLKITFITSASLFLLIVLVYCGAAYYINRNNKQILGTILSQLNAKVSGEVSVKSMETTLLQGFPGVSVSLKNVLLRDSLYANHRHDLLNAGDIDVSLNVLSLISGNINIRKIGINNAKIYLYTDSNGYSNTSMFKTKSQKKAENSKESTPFAIKKVNLNKVSLIIDNQKRRKLFNFDIDRVRGNVDYPFSGWDANISLKTDIKSFAFNTRKGSFLKDQLLEGTLIAHYNEDSQVVTIDQNKLSIGNEDYYIGAKIDLSKNDSSFQVDIKADDVLYQNIASILSPNISSKLLKFKIEKPIGVVGHIIDNGDKTQKDPLINVRMTVKDNNVTIPSGILTACNFVGTFTNKDTLNRPIGDENSAIKFYQLKADYYNAPIVADTFMITNLARPLAAGLVTSKFDLDKLNSSIGGETYKFKDGTADLRLYCKADIENFMFTKPVLSGNIAIKDADILYVPRNMHLIKSSLNLNFNQKDLNITSTRFQLGKSVVNVNLAIQNFLNFYYTDPEKILVNLSMKSPQLHLNEFLPFLGPRKGVIRKKRSKNSLKEVSDQLSNVLEAAKIKIQLDVDKAVYGEFIANNLKAEIMLQGNSINFNNITVNHAGGKVAFNGAIKQLGSINKFTINSNISSVNVKEFFYAFDNFGQQSITNKNLRGFLSAKVNAQGSMTEKGNIVKRSMYGKVNFSLKKAALVNFEPLQKVQKLAFANRDFSNIVIETLNGTLTLNGDKINISPMQVNTSVLNFDMKGIYGLDKGTDIAMDIPLRNPKKSEGISNKSELKLARMKGIVLHLKAVDDGTGGLKVRWNKDHDK
jgi:hypothetical protein